MAIVTISKGSERGGQAVANLVARALGCPCVGRDIVASAAVKLGVPADLVDLKIARPPGWWDRVRAERDDYVAALQAALAERIVTGELVYHSYVGHLLLQDLQCVLRVRVIAPQAARIQEAIDSEGIDAEAARARVKAHDEERLEWSKSVYGADWSNAALYDMVLSLDRLTVEQAAACVIDAAGAPRFSVTGETKTWLQDFLLASKGQRRPGISSITR